MEDVEFATLEWVDPPSLSRWSRSFAVGVVDYEV